MSDIGELSIEESMIKNIKDYNSIKDEIICEICQGILIKPKQCNSCENNFCEKCINKWLLKNNSCPNRCKKFTLKESPKLMKKLLDKLIIQCNLCKNDFHYETYVYKHFEKCVIEKKVVKCPFCSDCKIKYKALEDYKNKFIQEKNDLLKQIQKYKEKIKELESKDKSRLRWSHNQRCGEFELSDQDTTIKVLYNDCYQIYLLDNIFANNLENSFGLHVDTFGKLYDYMSIGFINENFDFDCLCCKPKNAFYLRVDEESIYYNDKKISTKLDDKTDLSLRFILDLNRNKLEIKDYDTDHSYGIVDIKGVSFKFFVSKCNYGIIEYSLLP